MRASSSASFNNTLSIVVYCIIKRTIWAIAKKDEFYSIYWSEYNLVKESGSSELREMPDYLNQDRPSFEARA